MKPFARIAVALAAASLAVLAACSSSPTTTQAAELAVAIDLVTGAAVQQGTSDQAVWKLRAVTFKSAATTLKAVNDAGAGATLATLQADLAPLIAKLGPADVLAANALVTALTVIIQQQIGTGTAAGKLAATQATVDIILSDVISACAAYGA